MPRVPTYGTPQVEARPLAGARQVAPDSVLPQVGAALQQAGGALGDVALRQQHQANLDSVLRAETGLKDAYLGFENSVRDRRGVNAWNATIDAEEWWRKNGDSFLGQLENDEQRTAFRSTVARLRDQSLTTISRHESGERNAAVEESTRSSIAGTIALAARNAADPAAVDTARGDVLRRVAALAMTNGWAPDRHELEAREHLTSLHKQVLENLVEINPEAAQQYYDAHTDEIDGAELDNVGKLVRLGGLRARAQVATDSIMAEDLTQPEALARVQATYEGEERDEIEQRVKVRYAEREAERQRRERRVADEAWGVFARSGSVASIPTAVLNEVDGRTLQSLKMAERERTGTRTQTNWDSYYALRQMAAEFPAEFAKLDLRQHFGELDEPEMRQLIDMQGKVRSPDGANDVATLSQQLADVHDMLEMDVETRGKFDSVATSAIQSETKLRGRALSYDERQKVIDQMLIQGRSRHGWFPRQQRFYEVVGTPEEDEFLTEARFFDVGALRKVLDFNWAGVDYETQREAFRRAVKETPGFSSLTPTQQRDLENLMEASARYVMRPPKVGEMDDGMWFTGGDPQDPANWKPTLPAQLVDYLNSRDLPTGVTEEDVQYTMKLRGLTREQVLEALRP
jgi:hypothetical protein